MGDTGFATTNGANGYSFGDSTGLRVLIAGAGIGGLSAAIALRNQGHDVQVFEQASSIRGIGYGIHLAPNGVGLLRFLGLHPELGGAVPMNKIRFFRHTGEQFAAEDRKITADKWQNEWLLASRVNLLGELLRLATTTEGKGKPVTVHTSSKIRSVDPKKGTLELEDGSMIQGDIVIGADGVYSRVRDAITKIAPYRSSHNCFRIMFSRKDLEKDPSVHLPPDETMDMIYGPQTKTIIYTTLDNTKYNCVVTHKAELTAGHVEDPKQKLLQICEGHDAKFINLFQKAEPASLKVWPLYDMDTLPTFAKDRLAIIGDAAHPFTPHLAQGAVMALEDAIAVSVMLSPGVTPAEVPERLQLFNNARHERGTFIQKLSLVVGGDRVDQTEVKGPKSLSVQKNLDLALSHDEHHASKQLLREWQWHRARNVSWLQPMVFGPVMERMDNLGRMSDTKASPSIVTATIKFRTSATLLRSMFPNNDYAFTKPDTVAIVSICVQNFSNVGWLAGGGHDSLAFYIHDVQRKPPQEGKSAEVGSYCPIMFDNLADAVVFQREKCGFPKVYSDISCTSEANHYQARMSWRGAEWAVLDLENILPEADIQEKEQQHSDTAPGIPVRNYMPGSGEPLPGSTAKQHQDADAEYDIFHIPGREMTEGAVRSRATSAEIQIKDLGFDVLPTLHHIVGRLAELPIFSIVEATVVTQQG